MQVIYQMILSYQKFKYLDAIRRIRGRLFGALLKTELLLVKNVIKPLTKSVLISLGFTAAASAADAGIHKKIRVRNNNTNKVK